MTDERADSIEEVLFVRLAALEFVVQILAANTELPPTVSEEMQMYILRTVFPHGDTPLGADSRRRATRQIERRIRVLLSLPDSPAEASTSD